MLISGHPSHARIVSILGMHRCGTSVVARLLNLLGINLGPKEVLVEPGFDNPKGFWEHRDLTSINEQILNLFGGNHLHPPELPEGWENSTTLALLKSQALEVIERDFAGSHFWGWKDPRNSLTLPFWQQLLPKMKLVICLRNPVDVAHSLESRNGLGFEASMELWLRHARTALKHASKWPHMFIFYEDVVQDWRAEARRLCYFVFGEDRTGNEAVQTRLREFIDEGLSHHHTTMAHTLSDPKVPFSAKSLFLTLRIGVNHEKNAIHKLTDAEFNSGLLASLKNNRTGQMSGGVKSLEISPTQVPYRQSPVKNELAPDRALHRDPLAVTFISHDAGRAGAPRVLLTLIEWLKQHKEVEPRVILRRSGPLLEEFRRLVPVFEVEPLADRGWDQVRADIVNFCRGTAMIYVNTLVPGDIAEALSELRVPIIVHAHEMEYVIQKSCDPIHVENLLSIADKFIAVCSSVADNLSRRYDISPERIHTVHPFLGHSTADSTLPETTRVRHERQLPVEGFIVFGCGTMDWRKAPDLFVEVARIMIQELNLPDVYFYWIGPEAEEFDLAQLKRAVVEMNLEKYVHFLGEMENPAIYFAGGDVFLLTSREDPFPLVCLEAAEQGLPIFCFEKAGGMPDFVRDDAGYAAPFADVRAMADKLAWLSVNADEKQRWGRNAQRRVREDHTDSKGAEQIWQSITQLAVLPADRLYAAKTERLRGVLRTERSAREAERAESGKQISKLAAQSRSAEIYAKSLEDENHRIQNGLATERATRQAEQTQAVNQIEKLTDLNRSAEQYATSLQAETRCLQDALKTETAHRQRQESEAGQQVTALTESIRTAELYARSLEVELHRLQEEYKAERTQAAQEIHSVKTELELYKSNWLFRLVRRFSRRKFIK